jgi:cytochrome bd-type quinol oxidase subunit 1
MTYLGVIIGLIIMAAIIYLAVNKKSNFAVRIACLAALALMMLTIIICVFLVFTDNRVPVDISVLIVGAPAAVKEDKNNNLWGMILLILFLFAILFVIAFIVMKENKKNSSISAEVPEPSKDFSL